MWDNFCEKCPLSINSRNGKPCGQQYCWGKVTIAAHLRNEGREGEISEIPEWLDDYPPS